MAILYPNINATLRRKTGYDANGRPVWGAASNIKLAIVTLRHVTERSSVRADSSASRGRAEESRADGIILVPPEIALSTEDRISMLGRSYEITMAFPRHGLDGSLGHTQVELRILTEG